LTGNRTADHIALFFQEAAGVGKYTGTDSLLDALRAEYASVKNIFLDFYDAHADQAAALMSDLQSAATDEEQAAVITRIWLPELDLSEEAILARWLVRNVKPVDPLSPLQVTLQLNGLYTVPEEEPVDLAPDVERAWKALGGAYGNKLADYDHPVPLFARDDEHELLTCLDELETDLAFEKDRGVLPRDHKMLITLSLSVTHERLDSLCGMWIESLLRNRVYQHIRVLILTEEAIARIKKAFLASDYPVYGVVGKYARHFNALKYTQLLLEKAYGIRAGFKLDTDEGLRSRDVYAATGRTWLQHLCHSRWGAEATDWKGRAVTLDINEGEYINSTDIDRLGYTKARRCPDVRVPESPVHPSIFFNKDFAHGKATALYNRFDRLDDHISHPVVKGGGYGITNNGIRKAVPFTLSQVGRAEDQQFYFSGLARGIRGIFHPDLRIAHYKESVARFEQGTRATRFIGDLYRLVLFQELAGQLAVKDDIDPMPGAFAGDLARCQAFFHLLYRAYSFAAEGDAKNCELLVYEGRDQLHRLQQEIDTGGIRGKLDEEHDQWREFIGETDALRQPARVRALLDSMIV